MRAVHIYGGAALLTFGVCLVSVPAGIAVGGVFLIWLGLTWVK